MSYSYLLLGPVLFQDFELPEGIVWGGKQALAVHRLPGGTRVIDAMGRDDCLISWSGVFSGSNAHYRAQAIDLLRADGGAWPLTWDTFFYTVIISDFTAEYRQPNWIPYRLTCTVLRDEAEAVVQQGLAVAADATNDVSAALGMTSGVIADLVPTALVAAVAASSGASPGSTSRTTTSSQLGAVSHAATSRLNTLSNSLAQTTNVQQASLLAGQAAHVAAARGYLLRAGTNLANAV